MLVYKSLNFGRNKYAVFVSGSNSWFVRGINWNNGAITGPLAFNMWNGEVNSGVGSRVVVVFRTSINIGIVLVTI